MNTKTYWLKIWLLAMAISLAACANQAAVNTSTSVDPPSSSASSPTAATPAANPYAAMKPWPASANELLGNLKLAIDNDWLLQPAFYEEQNLRGFFGTREKVWDHAVVPLSPRFGINSASYVRERKTFTDEQLKTMSYFDRTDATVSGATGLSPQQKRNGNIRLYLRERSVFFSEVERIFGTNWKFNPPGFPPSGHAVLPPVTHPMGLKYVLFDLGTDVHAKTIQIRTHGNGAIDTFLVLAGEK